MPHKHEFPPIKYNNDKKYTRTSSPTVKKADIVPSIDLLSREVFLKDIYSISTSKKRN